MRRACIFWAPLLALACMAPALAAPEELPRPADPAALLAVNRTWPPERRDEATYTEEPCDPYTPSVGPAGRGEIDDIFQYWEDNGYPEDVSYAYNFGFEVVSRPEGDVVYSFWQIGLVDADEARRQEILDLLSPTCQVKFYACRYTHSQKLKVYQELLALTAGDEDVWNVSIMRNWDSLYLAVRPEREQEYLELLGRIYGPDAVSDLQLADPDNPPLICVGSELSQWKDTLTPFFPVEAESEGPRPFGGAYAPWIIFLAAALAGLAWLALRRRASPVPVTGAAAPAARRPSRAQTAAAVRRSAVEPDPDLFRQILQKIDPPQR